jgi:hypothetical protein
MQLPTQSIIDTLPAKNILAEKINTQPGTLSAMQMQPGT